jgi:hypothetical protein
MKPEIDQIELSKVYNRRRTDRDIFQELMPFKVKELLLVATYYDSYAIVREGRFFDKIFGEYLQLNLITAPRITSVANTQEAMQALASTEFEMVILMAGLDLDISINTARLIKQHKPGISILLLVNNNSELRYIHENLSLSQYIERVFVWNGDTRVFLAMIKYVEDKKNVAIDTEVGDVRIILLVEDSERYYSRYLPLLYSILMTQTQALISEESYDQLHQMLKMRVRPKILLAGTYEEAVEIIDTYLDNLICVISDVKYKRNQIPDDHAGVELIRYVGTKAFIPCLLQSSDVGNALKAQEVNAEFIDKNADNLSSLITRFINRRLGFGTFEFVNSRGMKVATAANLREFIKCIEEIPPESLLFHARQDSISTWLMARGEINLAKRLRPYRIEDFDSSNKLRQTILSIFEEVEMERIRGRVVTFEPDMVTSNHYVVRIGEGSFGGKGRGLAFISNFLENIDFHNIIKGLNIGIPPTTIIGTGEFTWFMETNNLTAKAIDENDYQQLQQLFIAAELSPLLTKTLRQYIEAIDKPLAVRSSGLFEDSLMQPFAGVYSTYVLPNNHPDIEIRLRQLTTAIKLVYASMFSPSAKSYFKAVSYKIEEEQMAVILQPLVGQRAGDHFYPNISGVAQSFNYYPFAAMKPEDGFAVLCVGLGKYVVGGEKAYRFCPQHPLLELNAIPEQVKDSQTHFYALDLSLQSQDEQHIDEDAFIVRLPIREAEEDGNLKHCAMVFDYNFEQLVNDFSKRGPRVVNFSNIIKFDYIPLASTLSLLLRFLKEAMGTPVEIEFAVDLENGDHQQPTLYILQIKPLIRVESHTEISFEAIAPEKIILKSMKGMGNGRIETIRDIIFFDVERFDRTQTEEMAAEIASLNEMMVQQQKEYVLIGPGRWGTRDKFTGIPVQWSQISGAKVIVEMGLKAFPLEASLGSHFFHNVTSMNVGYFSIMHNSPDEWVNLELLEQMPVMHQTHYFKHVEVPGGFTILMNGREQQAVIVMH